MSNERSYLQHICNQNPNCNKAEHCSTTIECTTIGDLINGEKRYIKGIGSCKCEICKNCKWYVAYEGVCVNGESEKCADFTDKDFSCEKFENGVIGGEKG